jgi:plasmid stability protein
VRNITVTVPDDVYRRARVLAAEQGRSVSALVTEFLAGLAAREAEFARLEALQREVQESIDRFSGADRLTRTEVHSRALR